MRKRLEDELFWRIRYSFTISYESFYIDTGRELDFLYRNIRQEIRSRLFEIK